MSLPDANERMVDSFNVKNVETYVDFLESAYIKRCLMRVNKENPLVKIDFLDLMIVLDKFFAVVAEETGADRAIGNRIEYGKRLYDFIKKHIISVIVRRLQDKHWIVDIIKREEPGGYVFEGLEMTDAMIIKLPQQNAYSEENI
jgi:hypothetical protein